LLKEVEESYRRGKRFKYVDSILDEENTNYYYEPFDDVVPSSNRIRKGPSQTMSPNAVTQEYLHCPLKVTLYGDGDVSTLCGARARK
jgi:hypothetical protein